MASKQTYECFTCKNNGFSSVMVYLAGKDDKGRAIRLEDDGTTPHTHKTKAPSQQQQPQQHTQQPLKQPQDVDLVLEVKLLHQKLDKVLSLLEKERG